MLLYIANMELMGRAFSVVWPNYIANHITGALKDLKPWFGKSGYFTSITSLKGTKW